jgi:hypothetical protein
VPAKRAPARAPARAPGRRPGKATPQPPTAAAPPPASPDATGGGGGGGGPGGYDVSYDPTLGTQLQTPYNDAMAGGAYGALPGMMQEVGGASGLAGGTMGAFGGMIGQESGLQGNIYSRLQDAYQGKPIFDPMVETQLGQQGQALQDQLRRSLGPDYAASSAGSEAIQRFQEQANHTRANAQYAAIADLTSGAQQGYGLSGQLGQNYGQMTYDQSMGLGNAMWSGQGNQQQLASGQMGLMNQPGQYLMGAGTGLSGLSGNAVGAESPYLTDKQGQFAASQFPSRGQFAGGMMRQSGNAWENVGGSVGSMGPKQ